MIKESDFCTEYVADDIFKTKKSGRTRAKREKKSKYVCITGKCSKTLNTSCLPKAETIRADPDQTMEQSGQGLLCLLF